MGIKTLVDTVKVENALRAHNCQANNKHRIQKGEIRLAVKNQRSWNYYCKTCGENIISRDIEKLQALLPLSSSNHLARATDG